MQQLTEKQQKFIEELRICLHPKKAAEAAGYASSGAAAAANHNLNNTRVLLALLHGEQVAADGEAQAILGFFKQVMEDNVQAEGEVPLKDRMRAAELLGRSMGLFSADVERAPDTPVVVVDNI